MIWTKNWSEERYVRLYVRDTVTWAKLRFCGQTTLMHMLRKVNRVGLLPLEGDSLENIVALIGHPEEWDHTWRPGLEKLIEHDVVRVLGEGRDTCLWVVKFLEAQETVASDAQRQRAKRERDRDNLLALKAGLPVTLRDKPSRNVTRPSRRVPKPSPRAVPVHASSSASPPGGVAAATRVEEPVQCVLKEVAPPEKTPPARASAPRRAAGKRAAQAPQPAQAPAVDEADVRALFSATDEVHRAAYPRPDGASGGVPHPLTLTDAGRRRLARLLRDWLPVPYSEGLRGQALRTEYTARLRLALTHPVKARRRETLPAFLQMWHAFRAEGSGGLEAQPKPAGADVGGHQAAEPEACAVAYCEGVSRQGHTHEQHLCAQHTVALLDWLQDKPWEGREALAAEWVQAQALRVQGVQAQWTGQPPALRVVGGVP